jgi:hypothetical protein
MVNRKGIFSFLLITFGTTYLAEGLLILSGFRISLIPPILGQYVILGVMWVPAAAALITTRWITHEKLSSTWPRFGKSWKPYAVTALIIPVCFAIIYGLTWAFGFGQPDWQLANLFNMIAASGADMSGAPSPGTVLGGVLVASLLIGPWFNSLIAFGEEWGWRGYLLPRIMPLGKWRAYLLLGAIWGLWHAPLILVGFNYPGYPLLGILLMMFMTTALGIYMNELTLRYESAFLAGWIHGVFNSQGYGIWRILFPNMNPIFGGHTGLIGTLVLLILGWVTLRWLKRHDPHGERNELEE